MPELISLFNEDFWVELKQKRQGYVREVMKVAIAMAYICQKTDRVHHIFRRSFVENKRSVGYVNWAA